MKLTQYKLRSDASFIICWLEEGRAKIGDKVTLKDLNDQERLWTIEEEYSSIESDKINRGWDIDI